MEVPEPVVEVQVNHRTVLNLGVLSFLGSGIIMIISHLHVLNCIAFFFLPALIHLHLLRVKIMLHLLRQRRWQSQLWKSR